MSDQELMQRIKVQLGIPIEAACDGWSVPAAAVAALVANESGGDSNATRFEPATFIVSGSAQDQLDFTLQLLAWFAERYQFDAATDFPPLFHCWNPGTPEDPPATFEHPKDRCRELWFSTSHAASYPRGNSTEAQGVKKEGRS